MTANELTAERLRDLVAEWFAQHYNPKPRRQMMNRPTALAGFSAGMILYPLWPILIYLMLGFITMDLNPTHWEQSQRAGAVFACVLFGPFWMMAVEHGLLPALARLIEEWAAAGETDDG